MPRRWPQKHTTDIKRLAAKWAKDQYYKLKKKASFTKLANILPNAANNMLDSLGIWAEDLDIPAGWNLVYISKLKFKANINYYRTYKS